MGRRAGPPQRWRGCHGSWPVQALPCLVWCFSSSSGRRTERDRIDCGAPRMTTPWDCMRWLCHVHLRRGVRRGAGSDVIHSYSDPNTGAQFVLGLAGTLVGTKGARVARQPPGLALCRRSRLLGRWIGAAPHIGEGGARPRAGLGDADLRPSPERDPYLLARAPRGAYRPTHRAAGGEAARQVVLPRVEDLDSAGGWWQKRAPPGVVMSRFVAGIPGSHRGHKNCLTPGYERL